MPKKKQVSSKGDGKKVVSMVGKFSRQAKREKNLKVQRKELAKARIAQDRNLTLVDSERPLPTSQVGGAFLTLRRMSLDALLPHPRNPRNHPKEGSPGWLQLERSLEHDYFDPIVWNERNGMLVSGHFRVKVLKKMGCTLADVVVKDYDEPTHIARMLAANKALGENDDEAMSHLFSDLQNVELDGILDLTSYSIEEVEELVDGYMEEMPEEGSDRMQETPLVDGNASKEMMSMVGRRAIETSLSSLYVIGGKHILIVAKVKAATQEVAKCIQGGAAAWIGTEAAGIESRLALVPCMTHLVGLDVDQFEERWVIWVTETFSADVIVNSYAAVFGADSVVLRATYTGGRWQSY